MKNVDLIFLLFFLLALFLPVSISLSEGLYFLILLIFIYKKVMKKQNFKCSFPHPGIFAIYILFPLISFFNSSDILKSTIWYKRHIYFLLLTIVTPLAKNTLQEKEKLLKAYLLGATVSSLYAILQVFFGLRLQKPFNPSTYYTFASGFLSHPLTYSETTSFAIVISLFLLFSNESKKKPVIYLVAFSTNMLGLIFSREKMPLIATIIIVLLFITNMLFQKQNRNKAITILILLAFIAIILPDKGKILWRFNKNKVNLSLNERLKIWRQGIEDFKHHPVAGIGFGNFKIVIKKWNNKGEQTLFHAHNNLIEVLATTGLAGLLAFLLFHITIFYEVTKSIVKERKNLFFITILSIFSLYHLEGLSECTFKDTELNLQIIFFLSLFFVYKCLHKENKHATCKEK